MRDILIKKLHEYIRENNPDVLLQLEEEGKVSEYLSEKISTVDALINQSGKGQPAYIIEEACMDVLTEELRPSRYNYIQSILEEEFEPVYQQLQQSGTLQFEIINIIEQCKPVFEDLNFSEQTMDNRFLRYAITGVISEYLDMNATSEKENVRNELQQSTKTKG